jgi:hypothetical protein
MSAIVSPVVAEQDYLFAIQASVFKTAAATTKIRLFKNDIVPGPGSLFADFTEADFTGYSAITVASWTSIAIDGVSGRFYVGSGLQTFSQSGVLITNTVYGMYVEDGAGGLLLASRFDTPVSMDTSGKTIDLLLKIFNSGMDGPDPFED